MRDIAEIIQEIEEFENAIRVFELPQWQTIVEMAKERRDGHVQRVMNAGANKMTPEEVEQRRGKASELLWLIELEAETRNQLTQTQQELSEAQDEQLNALAAE